MDEAYAKDPWLFLTTACFTFDSHRPPGQQVGLFPDRLPLQAALEAIHVSPKSMVMKSRQLLFSWMLCGYSLWKAMYGGDAAWVLLQSRKEEDAAELVCVRTWALWDNLPPMLKALHPLLGKNPSKKPPEIHFAPREGGPGARITGVPQGPDQWRSRTITFGFSDEAAFQERFSSCWMAADACVHGGGQHCSVTTPNGPNFAWRVFEDHRDLLPVGMKLEDPVEDEPCRGLRITLNRNKVTAIRAHRYMFPERDETRTPEGKLWYAEHRPGKAKHQWDQEQEISPHSFKGQPVLYDFDEDYHSRQRLEFAPKLPILVGLDYGFRRPYAVFAQARNRTIYAIWELMGSDITVEVFADALLWACGLPLSRLLAEPPADWQPDDGWAKRQRLKSRKTEARRMRALRAAANAGKFENVADFDSMPRFSLRTYKFQCYDDPAGDQRNDKSEYTSRQIMNSRGFYPVPGEVSANDRMKLAQGLFLPAMEDERPRTIISRLGCPILFAGAAGGWRFPEDIDDRSRKVLPDKQHDDYFNHAWDGFTYMASMVEQPDFETLLRRNPPPGSLAYDEQQEEEERARREDWL